MDSGPIGGRLLLQAVLILVNAFFAAAEIAVVSLNENKLRKQAEDGDKKASLMLRMTQQPTGFLSTIQIAITLAGFLGSAFAADAFSGRIVRLVYDDWGFRALSEGTLDTLAVLLITMILSYFTLVLGELAPKRIAMKYPEKVARFVASPIHAVSVCVKPAVWLLSKSTNGVLRLFHIDPVDEQENVTEDEIRMMVDIGEETGAIEEAEKEMIENIFEFNNMAASDCMTHRIDMTAIWAEDSEDEIIKTIEETGLSRFPVYDEDIDDIIGTLTTRDFLLNARRDAQHKKPLKALLRPARFVPESVRTDVLFREMQKDKIHLCIVVDEYGGTSGLVTMEDLLEEIVGNIYDEYDPQDAPEIEQLSDTAWRVSGGVSLETLNERLGTELPTDEEFDTLGGLMFSRLSTIPQDGTRPSVECYGVRITAETILERRVESAVVEKLATE